MTRYFMPFAKVSNFEGQKIFGKKKKFFEVEKHFEWRQGEIFT